MVGFSAALINEVSKPFDIVALWVSFIVGMLASGVAVGAFDGLLRVQAITGQTLWRQLAVAPFAYLAAYSLVIVGALLNRWVSVISCVRADIDHFLNHCSSSLSINASHPLLCRLSAVCAAAIA